MGAELWWLAHPKPDAGEILNHDAWKLTVAHVCTWPEVSQSDLMSQHSPLLSVPQRNQLAGMANLYAKGLELEMRRAFLEISCTPHCEVSKLADSML